MYIAIPQLYKMDSDKHPILVLVESDDDESSEESLNEASRCREAQTSQGKVLMVDLRRGERQSDVPLRMLRNIGVPESEIENVPQAGRGVPRSHDYDRIIPYSCITRLKAKIAMRDQYIRELLEQIERLEAPDEDSTP